MPWRVLLPLIFLPLSVIRPSEAAASETANGARSGGVDLRLTPPTSPFAPVPAKAARPHWLPGAGAGLPVDPDAAYRWPRANVLVRFLHDLYEIPADIPEWDGTDVGTFAAFASVTGLLMLPPGPPDVALQDAVNRVMQGRRLVWTPLGDALIWTTIYAAMAGVYLDGWLGGKPPLMEAFSLTLEAFSVAEIYQVVPKLLIGREGPENGDGRALIKGPAWGWRLFPAGTPSGHAASLYAMIGALTTYFDSPALAIALHTFGVIFCATLLIDDYHFLSDIVWGASMGFFVGRWVVHHRAGRFAPNGERPAPPGGFFVMPTIDPAGGRYGLSLALRF